MKNLTAVIYAAALCFCFGITGIVVLVIFAPEGTDIAAVLSQIFTGLAALGGAAVALLTRNKVETMDKKVEYLANGGTDSKNRAAIADVLKPEFIRDDAADLLDADRIHRTNGPAKN